MFSIGWTKERYLALLDEQVCGLGDEERESLDLSPVLDMKRLYAESERIWKSRRGDEYWEDCGWYEQPPYPLDESVLDNPNHY